MNEAQFQCFRVVPFPRARVFAAHRDPTQLCRWWGPAGFTNTFHEFDFREGGRWRFTMHGPDGGNHENLWIFRRIVDGESIEMRHECLPYFSMQITLTDAPGGTRVDWLATFDDPKVLAALLSLITRANEENFDRLEAELRKAGSNPA